MYKELGGYIGYRKTPLRELQECKFSIIAEMNYQAEQSAETKQKQAEQEKELEELRNRLKR